MFGRAAVLSLLATALDFAIFFRLLGAGVDPLTAVLTGAGAGAVVSFVGGRLWVFGATDEAVVPQGTRHAVVVASSIVANALALELLTRGAGVAPGPARMIAAVLVLALHNFPLQARWVFRTR